MSNEYKRLKEELEGADLDSLLPGFDREASWKELSPRFQKAQKKTYWLGYAATLALIIVIAWTVRMQLNKQDKTQNVATVAPTQPAAGDTAPAITQPAPIVTTTPEKNIALQHPAKPKRKPAVKTIKQPEKIQLAEGLIANNPQQKAETVQEPGNVEQPVITQTKPIIKRPKAVHLLDIDNENRQAVIQNPRELQGGLPQRIVNLIPGRPYSNTENDRKPTSLFKTH
jgi:hypothetical protein